MREILFRAKSAEDDKWTYGYYCNAGYGDCDFPCILPSVKDEHFCWAVNQETVGQFTGLTDKNGVKIFEGDVVEYLLYLSNSSDAETAIIIFKNGMFLAGCENILTLVHNHDAVVIGNIYDNKELLK